MARTVSEVARLAGVSVRTLHHYDSIGLLKPAQLSPSGYRLYSERELERLQQILFFRELGFGLGEIRAILDRPDFDRQEALQRHRALLTRRATRLARLIRSVDRTIRAMEGGIPMDAREMFDGFDPAAYEQEARERWGETDAYRQSRERVSRYGEEEWAEIRAEQQDVHQGLAALAERDPGDDEVQALVARQHAWINRWFYDCPPQMFRGLGQMYEQDPRFAANFERLKPGLARFAHRAIEVYCERQQRAH